MNTGTDPIEIAPCVAYMDIELNKLSDPEREKRPLVRNLTTAATITSSKESNMMMEE